MNRAVLGHGDVTHPFIPGKIATVDLTTGAFVKWTGLGLGDVNGIAVDPETGTACTTTENPFQRGILQPRYSRGSVQPLPGAFNQLLSTVLFGEQALSLWHSPSQARRGVSGAAFMFMTDVTGNLIESIDGLTFECQTVAAFIALTRKRRFAASIRWSVDVGASEISRAFIIERRILRHRRALCYALAACSKTKLSLRQNSQRRCR